MMADVQQMALRRDLPLWPKLLLLLMMVLMVLQCRHRCDVIGAAHCNERRMHIASSSIYRRSYTYSGGDAISFHIYASWFSPPSCG